MNYRRGWICVFLFTLTLINYTDRMALSVSDKPIAAEFGLSSVEMGYLLSSFLWTYVLCLIPVGLLVDRLGSKTVNAAGIALWSVATVCTGFAPSYLVMLLTRMVMGMDESTSWPASNRVIREWFPASEPGLVNGIFGAGAASGLSTMHLTMERLASGAGDQRFAWQRGDTFSVPCWTRFEHAAADAQLFSMSDEPLMRFSRFCRFEAD